MAEIPWYVIKLENGQCAVVPESELSNFAEPETPGTDREQWGPFTSENEAIARRIGLIRAGKCQPA